jgi:RNA polymerase sigma-70 factor (ECF subfamily)
VLAFGPSFSTDRALARRCADGDPAAQRDLFERVRALVYAVVRRALRDEPSDVDDVAQETFAAIFRAVGSYRGDSALATWCYAIAHRTVQAHRARRRPAGAGSMIPAEELVAPTPGPDDVAMGHEVLARFVTLLDRIDPTMRNVYTLAVFDGRSMAEIAARTGASVAAVKTRLLRARRALARRAAQDEALGGFL